MAAAAGIALLAIAIWFWQTGPVQNDSQAIAQQTTPAPSTTVEPIVSQPDESLAYEETDRRRDKTPAPQHPTQAAEIQRGASDYATSSSSSSDEVAALERQPAPEPAPTKPTVYTAPGTSSPLKEEKNAAEGAARDVVVTDDESIDKAAGNSYPAAPAKAKSKSRDTKDAMKKSSPPPSAPSIGWEALQRELARTARLPEAARQNNISGSVRVKITLDKNGLPIDYQVVKSLGYGCDEEALRVLKNITTTWIRGANADVMVDVPFIR
jgi:TonB family protein